MNLEKLEGKIKELKSKASPKEGGDVLAERKIRKRLKRAQRKKCVMVRKAESLTAKSKKKEEAAS